MRIVRVSETLHGGPMVEVEPEPVDGTGTLQVSEELAQLLAPYLVSRDNIAVRFTANGLPTTATAVVSEMFVEIGEPVEYLRWYAVRAMVFATPTDKTGLNVYFQPVRTEFFKLPIGQDIPNGPIYNFREVYNDVEESSDDMERLLKLADQSYSKSRSDEASANTIVEKKQQPWWRKLFE
jgi:hypothetical protein